jgi:excisionase family DNA binding protein
MPRIVQGLKCYTIEEVAQALQVTPQTVRAWIKKDRLKASQVGRPILIAEANIKKFVKENLQA